MKAKLTTLVLTVFLMSFGISYGQEISLDHITGTMWHNQPDSIMAGSTYVFNIRFNGNGFNTKIDTTVFGDPASPDSTIIDTIVFSSYKGITNGFSVSSPDGATWTTTTVDTVGTLGSAQFELYFGMLSLSVTGSDADTVAFGGTSIIGSGLVPGFDEIVYEISIGPIPTGAIHHGQTICLDSAWYPFGTWKWAAPGLIEVIPSWDGPHCFTIIDDATDITETLDMLPYSFSLSQNYPNPFNPSTTITYALAKASDVHLTIYNIRGQKVTEFHRESQPAGSGDGYSFTWDANSVASGIYFYKLVAGDFTATKKMMLLK